MKKRVVLSLFFITATVLWKRSLAETDTDTQSSLELHTDTSVNSNGGTRIVSGLVIHPSKSSSGGGPRGPPGPPGPPGPQGPAGVATTTGGGGGGVTYIRWGRTTCSGPQGTELLYSGFAAGSFFTDDGGGSNHLCLTNNPNNTVSPDESPLEVLEDFQSERNMVYGAEYETHNSPRDSLGNLLQHNMPCAACYAAQRSAQIMIPGTVQCPETWTREYYGYIMTERARNRNSYECVDADAEAIPESGGNADGALFYFTEINCHNIYCPPYQQGSELVCVVCTK